MRRLDWERRAESRFKSDLYNRLSDNQGVNSDLNLSIEFGVQLFRIDFHDQCIAHRRQTFREKLFRLPPSSNRVNSQQVAPRQI